MLLEVHKIVEISINRCLARGSNKEPFRGAKKLGMTFISYLEIEKTGANRAPLL